MPKVTDPALLQQLSAPAINPTVALDRTGKNLRNQIDSAELARQPSLSSKAASDAAEAAANAIRARALAGTAPQLTQAELAKAQADAIVAGQKADEAKAEQAIATMAPNSNVHGDAYLQQFVPPAMWNVVKAYARGDLGSRSGGLSTSMLPIIQHAMNFDPSASGTNFPARVKMQSDLASGDPKSAGGSLQAFERMLLHGSNVLDAGLKLNNFHSGLLSGPLNSARAGLEGWNQNPNLASFNEEVRNYAPEAQKAIANVAGGEGERQSRGAAFSGSVSPEALVAGLQADARQAYGAMQATNDRYKRIMGHDILDALSPQAKAAYDKIMAGGFDPKTGKPLNAAPDWTPLSGGQPPAGGNGGAGGGTPPNFNGSGVGINNVEVDNAPPASYEKFRSALETGINSGQITTVQQAQQFARDNGGFELGDPKVIQANIDQVKAGLKANVASPTTQAAPPMTGPQAAIANYGGALTLNTLPKISAGLSALNDRLTTNTPLSVGDLYERQLDANRGQMDQAFTNHPFWSAGGTAAGMATGEGLIGRIPGVAAAMDGLPTAARAPAADAAYSAAMQAGGSDWNNPGNVGVKALIGGLAGGAGSVVGNGAAKGLGMAFRGVANPAARYLDNLGVPLTVGQVLGGTAKKAENALTSAPWVGSTVRNRYTEGMQGFNQAAFDQGLAPISATTGGVTGAPGVDLARTARSQAYGDALNGVSVTPDQQFNTAIDSARGLAATLPQDMAGRATFALDRAGENITPQGELSGTGLQQALRRFRRTTSQNASLPNGDDLGDVMGQAQDAYSGLLQRQAPDALPAYNAANTANRNVSILQDAVNRARNGARSGETDVFTPSQLSDAAAANSRQFGGTQGTTQQPFFDLTRAGQQVLPSTMPDSGTAGRLAMLSLPGGIVGGGAGAGYVAGDTKKGTAAGVGLAALLAMGGSKTGQKVLVRTLLDRPDFLTALGGKFVDRAPVGGMFGAGLGAGLTPSLIPQR